MEDSKAAIPEISELLQKQDKQLSKLQEDLEYLSGTSADIFNMVYEQIQSSSAQEIADVNQKVTAIEQALIKIHHYLKEDTVGKELKAGQQNLQMAIASLEAKKKKDPHNLVYLDWKQIAMIIVATAIISSLCSLATFQIASNLQTNKASTPTEKSLKPKIKKVPQR
jgi:t-SNARE complex subunit (syntaxin)